MRRLSVLLLALVSAGCSALSFLDEENADDSRVPSCLNTSDVTVRR
jgi:hypothetical protein